MVAFGMLNFEGERGTMCWKHVPFHIVRSHIQGQPNEPLAQITQPRARGGDESPGMWVDLWIWLFGHADSQGFRKSSVIQHDSNPLFDILGFLLALAIHDDIFATGLRDIEQVCRIEIPAHMNDVKLEVKGTKLDLLVFRRPARSVNEYPTLTAMGLLEYSSEPNAGYSSVPVATHLTQQDTRHAGCASK
jgi:hypothetical protein